MSTMPVQVRETTTTRRHLQRLLAAPLAALAVTIVWLLAKEAAGVNLHQPAFGSASSRPLGLAFAAVVGIVAALLGWGLLALFERFSRRGAARSWLRAALIALLVSLAGPLSGHGVSAGNRAALVAMHLAVAAVVIPWLYRTCSQALVMTTEQR